MLLNLRDMGFDPGDFALQCLDPFGQFVDRQRVQILPNQFDQRIAGPGREKFIQIHRQPALTQGLPKSISLPLRSGA